MSCKLKIYIPQEQKIQKALLKVNVEPESGNCSSLDLYVDGEQQAQLKLDDNWPGWFALNTHLLDDGNHTLEIKSGRKTMWKKKIETENNSGLGIRVRNLLREGSVPLVLQNEVSHSLFPDEPEADKPWFERTNGDQYIEQLKSAGKIDDLEAEQLHSFYQNGFIWLKDIVDDQLMEAINRDYDEIEADELLGFVKGSSQRVNGTHRHYESVRKLWKYSRVMRYLELIFQEKPLACQTLTFINGSQQELHQDTVHLTPFPAGNMCGVWFALEDIQEGSGELEFVPGSHRFENVYRDTVGCSKVIRPEWEEFEKTVVQEWRNQLNESGLDSEVYNAKKGDVLIWHENLLHGGRKRTNMDLSRRCLVGHYFADGSIAYYDSFGLPGFVQDAMS